MSNKEHNLGEGKNTGDLEQERTSSVATSKKNRNAAILVVLLIAFGISYYFFTSNEEPASDARQNTESSNNVSSISVEEQRKRSIPVSRDYDRIEALPPEMPSIPDLIAPPLPERPTSDQIQLPILPFASPSQNQISNVAEQKPMPPPGLEKNIKTMDEQQDRSTQMLVISGKGTPEYDTSSDHGININNPLSLINPSTISRIKDSLTTEKTPVSETAALARTSFPQVQTTYVGLLDYIVAQGKMIDAVVESAINTDLQGMLRAIVQKNVYSESGSRVLIPRGSRLIGKYDSNVTFAQTRVSIIWDRLMLPNGIDIAIGSPTTDPLGRTGIAGTVDAKFGNVFMNALLISAVKVGTSALVSKINGNQTITTTVDSGQGTTTTSGDSVALIANDASQKTSEAITQHLERYKDIKPTITINQGEKIKVFVNKDLVFSKEALGGY